MTMERPLKPKTGKRRVSMVEYGVNDLVDGLEKIYEVLDRTVSTPRDRDERMAWAKNAADRLLQGERITLPERKI